MNFLDTFSTSVSFNHRYWNFLWTASSVRTQLINERHCWSTNTTVPMCRSPCDNTHTHTYIHIYIYVCVCVCVCVRVCVCACVCMCVCVWDKCDQINWNFCFVLFIFGFFSQLISADLISLSAESILWITFFFIRFLKVFKRFDKY